MQGTASLDAISVKNGCMFSFYTLFKLKKNTFTQLLDIHFIGKKIIFKASPTHLLLPASLANSVFVTPVNAKKSLV